MTAVVVALGLVVALLAVLVVGLLRSHAEILRALHELGIRDDEPTGATTAAVPFSVRPGVSLPRGEGAVAQMTELVGTDPSGAALSVSLVGVEHRTLLVFLSTGCLTCADFWEAFADPDRLGLRADIRPVIVTKGLAEESQARVQQLAPPGITVVMATDAWGDFEVPVAPYAILLDGHEGRVLGEGASASWEQVRRLMHEALDDLAAIEEVPWRRARRGRGPEREASVDEELRAAGITPGHASLYDPSAAVGRPPAPEEGT